jgi:hypothetical protein
MRMPTLLPFGEGCMGGEAIDRRTVGAPTAAAVA